MLISNVKGHLSDPSLEQAATSPVHTDRVLGESRELTFPNTAIYCISGNDLSYSEDLARRMIPIELKFFGENINAREYRHPDLYTHVKQYRAYYLGALQSLVQAWVNAGCPVGRKNMNSFVRWSQVLGGIMEANGMPNPINSDSDAPSPNQTADHFTHLLVRTQEKFGDNELSKNDLQSIALEEELFGWFGDISADRKAKTKFGKLLSRMERRRFNGRYLIKDNTLTRPSFKVCND